MLKNRLEYIEQKWYDKVRFGRTVSCVLPHQTGTLELLMIKITLQNISIVSDMQYRTDVNIAHELIYKIQLISGNDTILDLDSSILKIMDSIKNVNQMQQTDNEILYQLDLRDFFVSMHSDTETSLPIRGIQMNRMSGSLRLYMFISDSPNILIDNCDLDKFDISSSILCGYAFNDSHIDNLHSSVQPSVQPLIQNTMNIQSKVRIPIYPQLKIPMYPKEYQVGCIKRLFMSTELGSVIKQCYIYMNDVCILCIDDLQMSNKFFECTNKCTLHKNTYAVDLNLLCDNTKDIIVNITFDHINYGDLLNIYLEYDVMVAKTMNGQINYNKMKEYYIKQQKEYDHEHKRINENFNRSMDDFNIDKEMSQLSNDLQIEILEKRLNAKCINHHKETDTDIKQLNEKVTELKNNITYLQKMTENFSKVIKNINTVTHQIDNACCICFEDTNKEIVLVPCGHRQYCSSCIGKINKCALCNSIITQKIRIY